LARTPKRLEESEHESTRSPGLAIDRLPTPYLVVHEGLIVYANRAAHAAFRVAIEQGLLGRELAELGEIPHAAARPEWVSAGELDWRRADATAFRAETSLLRAEQATHLLLHATALHEQGQRELERLREDVARLQTLGGLGRFEVSLSPTRKSWVSDGFYEILGRDPAAGGFSREEYLREIVHPEDREMVAATLAESVAQRRHYEMEYRIVRPGGEVRHVRSSGDPVLGAEGEIVCMRGALIDVTRMVQSATELRHQGAWLSAILDTAVEAIILIDPRGIIKSVNPATRRIFGYSPEELRGRNVKLLMPEPYQAEHDGYLERYLETGQRRIIGIGREVVGRRKDGTRFPMDLSVSEMLLGGERMFSGFVRDATERKRLEAESLHAQKNEVVGRLSEGIAHDFNNMLMGIRSCARLAEERLGEHDPARSLLSEIESTTQRGMAMTRRLLAFGRHQAAQLAPTSLGAVIQENVPMWRRLVGDDVDLVVECVAEGDVLLGDPGLLEQILINLVVNARDALPRGGRVWIETRRQDGEILLEVRDEGCGMDPATCARIFEPYFTTKPAGQGTGLGLSTVLRIVRELSGKIEVQSRPGGGTSFSIRFPATDRAPAPARKLLQQTAVARPGRETILLVEDEALIRFALRQSLTKLGYQVLAAADGLQALELASAHLGAIDLLVTDVVMPNLGGRELCERLHEGHPGLRAIFMSAHARETILRQGRLPENASYLEKPFDLGELALLVRQVLG
jgi:PAS domain S-box-containing protein